MRHISPKPSDDGSLSAAAALVRWYGSARRRLARQRARMRWALTTEPPGVTKELADVDSEELRLRCEWNNWRSALVARREGNLDAFHQGRFDQAWIELAEEGRCDGLGGAEWARVRGEWAAAGYPGNPAPFIVQRANAGPYPV